MTHPLEDISLLQVARGVEGEWNIRLIHLDGHTTNAFCSTAEATCDIVRRLLATGPTPVEQGDPQDGDRMTKLWELVDYFHTVTGMVHPEGDPSGSQAFEAAADYVQYIIDGEFDRLPWGVEKAVES